MQHERCALQHRLRVTVRSGHRLHQPLEAGDAHPGLAREGGERQAGLGAGSGAQGLVHRGVASVARRVGEPYDVRCEGRREVRCRQAQVGSDLQRFGGVLPVEELASQPAHGSTLPPGGACRCLDQRAIRQRRLKIEEA
jgi:hypothetical protein